MNSNFPWFGDDLIKSASKEMVTFYEPTSDEEEIERGSTADTKAPPDPTVSRRWTGRIEARSSNVAEIAESGPDGTRRLRLRRDRCDVLAIKVEVTRP